MRRAPALLLLVALVGGLGAASVHQAHHAVEWAEAQHSHDADHHGTNDDHASAPCLGVDLYGVDCAVCSGLSLAVSDGPADVLAATDADRLLAAAEAWAEVRRTTLPARGPPAVA